MRILHTSDWHLGKTLDNINRIEEQKQFIDELCEIAESESADLVLVAGIFLIHITHLPLLRSCFMMQLTG
jgi:exonuclease SbcD